MPCGQGKTCPSFEETIVRLRLFRKEESPNVFHKFPNKERRSKSSTKEIQFLTGHSKVGFGKQPYSFSSSRLLLQTAENAPLSRCLQFRGSGWRVRGTDPVTLFFILLSNIRFASFGNLGEARNHHPPLRATPQITPQVFQRSALRTPFFLYRPRHI